MYIIVPFIIITIIVAISFGASNFRNVNLEGENTSSIGSFFKDFLNINLNRKALEENRENESSSTIEQAQ